MRRRAPGILIGIAIIAMLAWYVDTMRDVADELRRENTISSRMFARIYAALNDTTPGANIDALLDLSGHVVEMGVPIVVTDTMGKVMWTANIPEDAKSDPAKMQKLIADLDLQNPPVGEHSVGGVVHYGRTPIERDTRWLPLLQVALLFSLVVAGLYALRTRARADREHVWAGMAREAAHQLGTPLSSLSGWIEVLRDRAQGSEESALRHMQADLERLERVAHRFERIGRPPRRDPVDIAGLAERVVTYFRARVPTLAHRVEISLSRPAEPLTIEGDAVLLEWVLEALLKNALDALAGRGGAVAVSVEALGGRGARVRIADNGPGIPREIRRRVFDAGFSTKEKGWGIGLSLARRIIREGHHGQLSLIPSPQGATFDVILR
jgi:signal transduction histidine kinase